MHTPVILIIIDGLRPDGLLQAEAPNIRNLMAQGTSCMIAQTVMPSVTLPCHVSLFMGVKPERHGITTNTWMPPVRPLPGLIDLLQQAGKKTAMFSNWEELRDISRPGALNTSFFMKNCYDPGGSGDVELAKLASRWLQTHTYDFIFIYLGYVDVAGHDFGWMSENYLKAITNADHCVALILDGLPAERIVIVTSDHGGHAQTHGTDSPEDMTIPLIIQGTGIPVGKILDEPVNIVDLAPTILGFYQLMPPHEWIGCPLKLLV
jgi:predicted AlkP superfamily pyrophosphatase or phosphodiesterase